MFENYIHEKNNQVTSFLQRQHISRVVIVPKTIFHTDPHISIPILPTYEYFHTNHI